MQKFGSEMLVTKKESKDGEEKSDNLGESQNNGRLKNINDYEI